MFLNALYENQHNLTQSSTDFQINIDIDSYD